ncbi:thymidylate kinase [Mahella sp.]|uniref:dTMP kinase n=1 Tax=Mahella sp. TaxID=2798721 RepID=UPI0025C5021A|nr:thymidylate kinase [Mahella sp.]MBZ4664792.1 thymidylate kinase [Mahella sp.]
MIQKDKLFYGSGLPYLKMDKLPGYLIVIEGADGSGRSTQINMLKDWLESRGHAVLDTGLKRSTLVGGTIDEAKKGNLLGRTTLSLLYATDFGDRLENNIIPALEAGFIVLADRYIFTLMARDMVRGARRAWLKEMFGFALIPDIVFYLQVSPDVLLHRAFMQYGHLDYWESGMDLGISPDMFKSFKQYQSMLKDQFDNLAQEYGFIIMDGSMDIETVQQRLREEILERIDL